MSDKIVDLFARAMQSAGEYNSVAGLLGRREANGAYTVEIPGRPHWVYARLGVGETTGWIEALNIHVPNLANTPVRLTKVFGQWVVTGLDISSPAVTSIHSNVPPHEHKRDNGLNQDVLDLDRMPSTLAGGAGQALIVNDDEDGFYIGDAGSISGAVSSVNGATGAVVLDADDIDDSATTHKFTSQSDIDKLAGIEAGADVTDAANIAAAIVGTSGKSTLVGTDTIPVLDSEDSYQVKQWSWTNALAQIAATFWTFTNKIAIAATATTGAALSVVRNLAAASTDSPVVSIHQDNSGDDQAALDVRQDGSGAIQGWYDGATRVAALIDGGFLILGPGDPVTQLHIASEVTTATRGLLLSQHSANAAAAAAFFRKSRGTKGTPGAISNGDFGGAFAMQFYDGSNYLQTAALAFRAVGTIAAGSVPTDIILATGATDDTSLTNERVRITSDGKVGIGVSSPQGIIHSYNNGGGHLVVTKTGVNGTPQVIIPNGSGDVARAAHVTFILSDGTSGVANTFTLVHSVTMSAAITVGGSTWTVTLNANGEVSVARTAGSGTATIKFTIDWI